MMDDMIRAHLEVSEKQEVINDNDLYYEYILEQRSSWLERCPEIMAYLYEEFTNDWIEYVEGLAEDMPVRNPKGFEVGDAVIASQDITWDMLVADGDQDVALHKGDSGYIEGLSDEDDMLWATVRWESPERHYGERFEVDTDWLDKDEVK